MEQKDRDLDFELRMCFDYSEFIKIVDRYRDNDRDIVLKDLVSYCPGSKITIKELENHLNSNGFNIGKKDLVHNLNSELGVSTIRKVKGRSNVNCLEDVSIKNPEITSTWLTQTQQEIILEAKNSLINNLIKLDYTPKQLALELSGNKLGVAYDIKNRGEDLIRLKKKVDGYHKVHDINNRTCELTICLVKRGIIDSNLEFHCLKNDIEYYPEVPKEGYDMGYVKSLTRHRGRMFEKGYQGLVEQGFYSVRPSKDGGELPPSS